MKVRILPLAIAGLFLGQPAAAELWMWTDPDGAIRYTSDRARIPGAQRGSALRVEAGMVLPAPAPTAEVAAPAAGVLLGPPDELALAPDPFNAPDQFPTLAVEEVVEVERTVVEERVAPVALDTPAQGASGETTATEAIAVSETTETAAIAVSETTETAAIAVSETTETAAIAVSETTAPAAAIAVSETTETAAVAAPATPTAPADATTTAALAAVSAPPATAGTPESESRMAELQQQIARDEDALKTLITDPDATDLENSPELHEIARRLPRLQAELRALERGEPVPAEQAE
ncbi:MAG: DUF4124 domain-containing protein [Myxococcota bacterium]|nr:DUF4124 domain-containing protein [Myxococcota bacterium]